MSESGWSLAYSTNKCSMSSLSIETHMWRLTHESQLQYPRPECSSVIADDEQADMQNKLVRMSSIPIQQWSCQGYPKWVTGCLLRGEPLDRIYLGFSLRDIQGYIDLVVTLNRIICLIISQIASRFDRQLTGLSLKIPSRWAASTYAIPAAAATSQQLPWATLVWLRQGF